MTVYEVLQYCEYSVHPKWSSIYKMINCETSNLMRSWSWKYEISETDSNREGSKKRNKSCMLKCTSWDTKHKPNFQPIMVSVKFLILNKQTKPVIHFSNNCSNVILWLFAVEEIEIIQLASTIRNVFFSAIECVCNLWKYLCLYLTVFLHCSDSYCIISHLQRIVFLLNELQFLLHNSSPTEIKELLASLLDCFLQPSASWGCSLSLTVFLPFFFFLSLAILGFILLPSALASYSQHCDDPCLPPGKDVLPAVFRIRAGAWSALTQHGRQQSARTRQHRFPPNPNAGRPGTQIHCNSLLLIFFFFTSCLK